jgi:hypothetical protein
MILDAWEGNLWALCLAERSFEGWKFSSANPSFQSIFFTTKQHLDAWEGNLLALFLAPRSFGLRGRLLCVICPRQDMSAAPLWGDTKLSCPDMSGHVWTCRKDMLANYVVETPFKDTQMSRPRLAEDMIGHYAFEAFLSYFQCQFIFYLHL